MRVIRGRVFRGALRGSVLSDGDSGSGGVLLPHFRVSATAGPWILKYSSNHYEQLGEGENDCDSKHPCEDTGQIQIVKPHSQ